ncbi:hypothetical protein QCA50_006831 [Cerrena zonata]|uniref:Uncharacterized protein n=1 Tax=Cerrena zonata TaxID=2478898 RepID=A0AAW0G9W5_9APHY
MTLHLHDSALPMFRYRPRITSLTSLPILPIPPQYLGPHVPHLFTTSLTCSTRPDSVLTIPFPHYPMASSHVIPRSRLPALTSSVQSHPPILQLFPSFSLPPAFVSSVPSLFLHFSFPPSRPLIGPLARY